MPLCRRLVPEKKWGVAILTNLNLNVLPESIRAELLERLLGRSSQDFQTEISERATQIAKMVIPPAPPADAAPPSLPLSAFTGKYFNEHYGHWSVIEKDGALSLEAGPAKLTGTLTHWDGDSFLNSWPYVNAGKDLVEFKTSGGHATGFEFNDFEFRREK